MGQERRWGRLGQRAQDHTRHLATQGADRPNPHACAELEPKAERQRGGMLPLDRDRTCGRCARELLKMR